MSCHEWVGFGLWAGMIFLLWRWSRKPRVQARGRHRVEPSDRRWARAHRVKR
jgi:hypothetical protein